MQCGRGCWVSFDLGLATSNVNIDPFDLVELEKKLEEELLEWHKRFGKDQPYEKTIIFDFNNSMKMFHMIEAQQFLDWWRGFKHHVLPSPEEHNDDTIDAMWWQTERAQEQREQQEKRNTESRKKWQDWQKQEKIKKFIWMGIGVTIIAMVMYKLKILAHIQHVLKNLRFTAI